MEELQSVLLTKKDSTPGIDEITYSMLKNLSKCVSDFIVIFYNELLGGKEIPTEWKIQIAYPILKPEKDSNLLDSYRPIILSSCIGKLLESIIKNRLDYHLENTKWLSPMQSGFRRVRGVMDNLTYFTVKINNCFDRNHKAVVVFLDISSAYENVIPAVLLKKLKKANIPKYLINLIQQFLKNRSIYIRDPKTRDLTGPQVTDNGLSQGSPLSPVLFNIYTNALHNRMADNTVLMRYADDFAIIGTENKVMDIIRQVNISLNNLLTVFTTLGFNLSLKKCKTILFQKRKTPQVLPDNYWGNSTIPWTLNIKYLEVAIDSNMKWKAHIEYAMKRALGGISVMKVISRVWWGAHPSTLNKGIVRSHLDYASILLSNCTKKITRKTG